MAVLQGCAATDGDLSDLRVMVPNPPGSGYDITARVLARTLDAAGIARGVEVFNLPGGSGVVGLRRLAYEHGNGRLVMLMGLGLVGAELAAGTPATLAGTTPVARLVQEPAILVVRRDSPYSSLDELIDGWRADPAGVRAGGGSSVGGPDHLATMLLAESVGLSPARVAYTRHDGGGDLLAAILGREVEFAMSGLSEYADQIRSGQLRALAVTSERPVDQVAAPTVRSVGFDIVVNNWRGIVAPPGLSAPDAEAIRAVIAALDASPDWADARARFGWTDAYLGGDAFARFMADERSRVAGVLNRLGVTAQA
ncbi:Bug family tripartite tricarboxylate transporter substrate binding protein [Couchioplanes caeruleus]|uniref:Bug family tripartite tricarboxylate transporter substrate binding protein n=1 Tax=Couchioplanes caeruleus TaxID=56438 RepID=UPI001FD19E86|nr:tripartite tricarboxylate transporter substrate binding protein [Couchioplanes caeruleus]